MQVDFYILGEHGREARERFACRLAEKAFREGVTVAVLAAGPAGASRVDELLWTFRQGSFIPHALAENAEPADPVVIAAGEPVQGYELLINLTDTLPPQWQDFPRVAEIVSADDEVRRPARGRYRTYRDAGVTPSNHQV